MVLVDVHYGSTIRISTVKNLWEEFPSILPTLPNLPKGAGLSIPPIPPFPPILPFSLACHLLYPSAHPVPAHALLHSLHTPSIQRHPPIHVSRSIPSFPLHLPGGSFLPFPSIPSFMSILPSLPSPLNLHIPPPFPVPPHLLSPPILPIHSLLIYTSHLSNTPFRYWHAICSPLVLGICILCNSPLAVLATLIPYPTGNLVLTICMLGYWQPRVGYGRLQAGCACVAGGLARGLVGGWQAPGPRLQPTICNPKPLRRNHLRQGCKNLKVGACKCRYTPYNVRCRVVGGGYHRVGLPPNATTPAPRV